MSTKQTASPSQGGVITPVFESLPSRRMGGRHSVSDYGLSPALALLRQKPMEWARVAEYPEKKTPHRIGAVINKGKSSIFGADFACSVRTLPSGTFALYMRFVGDAPEEK